LKVPSYHDAESESVVVIVPAIPPDYTPMSKLY
jgi:hypothetical protein